MYTKPTLDVQFLLRLIHIFFGLPFSELTRVWQSSPQVNVLQKLLRLQITAAASEPRVYRNVAIVSTTLYRQLTCKTFRWIPISLASRLLLLVKYPNVQQKITKRKRVFVQNQTKEVAFTELYMLTG